VIYGACGLLGTYLGGAWAMRFGAKNERLQLTMVAAAFAALGFVSVGMYLTKNYLLAFGLLAITMLASGLVQGPMFATIHALVPQRIRATTIALMYLSANLIGVGLGPLAAGVLSDAMARWAGVDSLRFALLALSPGYIWCAFHMYRASVTVGTDISRTESDPRAGGAQDEIAGARA
jgi:MFS family permease